MKNLIWMAGAGKVRWTPEEPLWLAGYLARKEPARGVHTDLWVTALALRDAKGETFVVASADVIAVSVQVGDAAAAIVRKNFPEVKRENFCFAATHTHYAPEIRRDKVPFFKIPAEYAAKVGAAEERLVQAIAEAIVKALEGMGPARLFARSAEASFGHNRRVVEGATTAGVTDHDVPVLEVRGEDGNVRAVMFGYACHNTCMDPQDRLYSSDWAGAARQLIEEKYPGCVGVFITGCGADQNPDPRGTKELSAQYGIELATAVEQAMSGEGVEIESKLRVASGAARLEMVPVSKEWIEEGLVSEDASRQVKAKYLKQRLDRGEELETWYPAALQAVKLGEELLMVILSSEVVVDWAHQFKGEFGRKGMKVWVAGYCNDMYGYVPTSRVQKEGGYEGGRANLWSWLPGVWTEDVEQILTAGVRQVVEKVRS